MIVRRINGGHALVAEYDLNSGTEGTESFSYLQDNCAGNPLDYGDTVHAYDSQSHTFPTGLPMVSVGLGAGGSGFAYAMVTGYLIPSSQLPPEPPAFHGRVKGMVDR